MAEPKSRIRLAPDELEKAIESEILRMLEAGDALPGEREMAERFSVSRYALRQSLGRLKQRNLIAMHPGAQTVRVVPNDYPASADFVSAELLLRPKAATFREVYGVRELIESGAAGQLAAREQREDIVGQLRNCIATIDDLATDSSRSAAATRMRSDLGFHGLLVHLLGNPLLDSIERTVLRALEDGLAIWMYGAGSRAGQKEHHDIIACIERGDTDGAAKMAALHIANGRHRLQTLLKHSLDELELDASSNVVGRAT